MRIAILTLQPHSNYGGILQAWALQTVLEKCGHEAGVIYKTERIKWKKTLCNLPSRLLHKYILNEPLPIMQESLDFKARKLIGTNTVPFINRHLHLLQVNALSEVRKYNPGALVIGSDQIWRPIYFSDRIENAYGKFAEKWNTCILSYAASFGIDSLKEYSSLDIKKVRRLIKKFQAVSVRESSGVEIIRNDFGVNAEHVLDPTMLLDKENYLDLIPADTLRRSGIMTYILDDFKEKDKFINTLSNELSMPVFTAKADTYGDIQPPVEEWLAGFRDASMIITDSFHACVFSILFNKPFWVIVNPVRGIARIESLLSMFNLKNRIIKDVSQTREEQTIDWDRVNNKLKEYRRNSLKFLTQNLT